MQLNEFLKDARYERFSRKPFYSPDGDTLTFFEEDREYHAERVDGLLTVFLDMKTGELVGCKIKGVRRILEVLSKFDIPTSQVLIDDQNETQGDVPLSSFFLAGLTLSDNNCRVYYERCGEASKGIRLKQDDLQFAEA